MSETLNFEFYGNSVLRWTIAIGVFFLATILVALLRKTITSRFDEKSKATETQIDDLLVELLKKTRPYFYAAIFLRASANILTLPPRDFGILQALFIIATLFQIIVWGNAATELLVQGYLKRHMSTDPRSVTTVRALGMVIRVTLVVIVLLIGLQHFGFNVTTLIAGLGIGGIAVALAMQNILGDLFGALSIMADKPFVVGDTIQVDSLLGTVERIGLKTTRLRGLTGEQLVFSNGDLLKSRIHNFKRMYQRRIAFTNSLTLNTPPEILEKIPPLIKEIVESQPHVKFSTCYFTTITETAFRVETVYMVLTPDFETYLKAQQGINLQILRRFKDIGATLVSPFPPVTIQRAAAQAAPAQGTQAGAGQ